MSLRNKLSRLESSIARSSAAAGSPPVVAPDRGRLLEDLRARIEATLARVARRTPNPPTPVQPVDLPFAVEHTPVGPLHVRAQRLPATHRTGWAPVVRARDASAPLLALLALDPALSTCDPRRALFLDTETTGLSGGAGTVAFLIGLAWWDEGGHLVLEQLFVRGLGEEAPVLERVGARIRDASMLVTYNGKSFDWPLLRARFVMTRMGVPDPPPHLDLLHVARRVHGKRIRSGCRLVSLEREVLGFERERDVESSDVSACYLHFLRTGDAGALLGVVEHNSWDVVAMAALMGLYGEPLHDGLPSCDLAGVARTLRRAGALDRAMAVAQTAVERDATPESLRARADIAKARGDRAAALADFEAIATAVDDASARLELAKLYEHWVKQPDRALQWVERGTGETAEGIRKRAERLRRKADRSRKRLPKEPSRPAGASACLAFAHEQATARGRGVSNGSMEHDPTARLAPVGPGGGALVSRVPDVAHVRVTTPEVPGQVAVADPDQALLLAPPRLPRKRIRKADHDPGQVGATLSVGGDALDTTVLAPETFGGVVEESVNVFGDGQVGRRSANLQDAAPLAFERPVHGDPDGLDEEVLPEDHRDQSLVLENASARPTQVSEPVGAGRPGARAV